VALGRLATANDVRSVAKWLSIERGQLTLIQAHALAAWHANITAQMPIEAVN
jgi:hypothetical protein